MTRPVVGIIGAGAWGTALALTFSRQGHAVRLWEFHPEYAELLRRTRENLKFLPGIAIPETLPIDSALENIVPEAEILFMVVPTQAWRGVAERAAGMARPDAVVVNASKGIEHGSLQTLSAVAAQTFGANRAYAVLSGPSHAEEAGRQLPCSLVLASAATETAERLQKLFSDPCFRIYTSRDVVGVELGGSLKNVVALAAGIVDGLELGDNAKAALLTRGLAEIRRLGQRLGARNETFFGLSGVGDLVVTCGSRHSRNRRVGEALGRGRTLSEILSHMEMVAEGVETTCSAYQLAQQLGVEMPITATVYRILFSGLPPREGLRELLTRPQRPEWDEDHRLETSRLGQ
jgi:glycerol-3-phosphate dehydrogenase (NAD(P)+)